MQLPVVTNHLRPLTLAAVGLMSTVPSFSYSDIDCFDNDTNGKEVIKYMSIVDSKDIDYISSKVKFQYHLMEWRRKTAFVSSVSKIIKDEDFLAIVAMGRVAVPYIKTELLAKPSILVWALNYIYGKKISNKPNLTIDEACRLWIKEI